MSEKNVVNAEIEELKKTINTYKGKLTTLELKKKEIEKETNELIAKTIYQKKQELERSYDEVIKEATQRLKASEKEKEEEKKKNLKRVVEHNTRSTRENNIYLNNEIRKLLKDNKIPSFVNSKLYMILWSPSKSSEKIFGFLVAIFVMIIPTILSFAVYKDKLIKFFPNNILRYIIIALIYLATIFVAGIIWLFVDKITKKKPSVLSEVKEMRKNIEDNVTQIKKIIENTNKEMTDDKFDYTRLDREIEAEKIEVENYKNKKKEAYDSFVNVTQDEISKNFELEAKKGIDIINSEIDKVKEELSKAQKQYDEAKLNLV